MILICVFLGFKFIFCSLSLQILRHYGGSYSLVTAHKGQNKTALIYCLSHRLANFSATQLHHSSYLSSTFMLSCRHSWHDADVAKARRLKLKAYPKPVELVYLVEEFAVTKKRKGCGKFERLEAFYLELHFLQISPFNPFSLWGSFRWF